MGARDTHAVTRVSMTFEGPDPPSGEGRLWGRWPEDISCFPLHCAQSAGKISPLLFFIFPEVPPVCPLPILLPGRPYHSEDLACPFPVSNFPFCGFHPWRFKPFPDLALTQKGYREEGKGVWTQIPCEIKPPNQKFCQNQTFIIHPI